MTVELELPCIPDSVGRARDAAGRFDRHLSDRRLGDLRLLVSELVTNAIRHAGLRAQDVIRVHLSIAGAHLRVEVWDPGAGFEPGTPDPDLTDPGGWGLYLVDQLAARWGVESGEQTLVWFELELA
jgi:anti-sigma regulatory factor (Ser/Thr protein kinase)